MTIMIAMGLALFVWWFSTGTILMVVKHADGADYHMRLNILMFGVPVLAAGLYGFWWSLPHDSLLGVYVAFLSALIIWGWIELAFLTGIVAGPNRDDLPENASGFERFRRAWGTVAYHEILLAAALLAMFAAAAQAQNLFGLWTFAVLFFARISAKLNLFLGVPRIHIEFLPKVLGHIPSHFRQSQMNGLFPISVTALTLAVACWLERLYSASDPGAACGFALLTALTALALLEHWLMVLPLPDERLWRWMLPAPEADDTQTTKTQTKMGGHHGL